ncbi:DUF1127 domain-containing protein [Roseibium sp. Sym1]|uniref:DUF1127 domain-containing protein n=1 Tax=Roseibium sp. Sym1 TaxID=3016006 RepID=UPI0022B4D336|nr:DUF1127 domain-containing protein [Roseibium sp. Sym1]
MSEPNAIPAGDMRRRLGFGALLLAIARHWQTQAVVRRDMTYLRRQPDRMLQDIGLNRADLPDIPNLNSNEHRRLRLRHR